MKNQKKLIILTGPSGVGKGTVVKEILGKDKNLFVELSYDSWKNKLLNS